MKHARLLAVALWTGAALGAADVETLWDFKDPAASESRFRQALAAAQGDAALVLRTQIARSYSLRKRFDEAHRELDAIEPHLAAAGIEPRVRSLLERGRTLRSAGQPAAARPLFAQAFEVAEAAQLEYLAADALHMAALAEDQLDARIAWNRRTVAYAQRARDPRAQGWQAAACNNLGSDLREAGRLDDSLAAFRQALAAYERIGHTDNVRIARWQVANVLRLQGRQEEALALQLALERDAQRAGSPDPYVYDELALLHEAAGRTEGAALARRRAKELRDGDRR